MSDDDTAREQLEFELRALLADPMPPEVADLPVDAFTWRTVDAELAELVAQAEASPEAAGVRATEVVLTFTFAARDVVIELELDPSTRSMVGQVLPGETATVLVRSGVESVEVDVDDVGVFRVARMPAGPVQLEVATVTRRLTTPWFVALPR